MVRRTLMAMRMTRAMVTMARTAMRMTRMTTTTMLAMTEVATTMDNLVLLAAAGMDAPALSHAVGQGDQGAQEAAVDPHEDLEEEVHQRPLHEEEADCARRLAAIRYCLSIPWRRVVSARGTPTWCLGSLVLANV